MEAFDDLRARCAKAEDETSVTDEVTTSGCHCHERCGTRVHVDNACSDFDAVCLCSEITHLRDCIEAVCLCNPDLVEASFFKFDDAVDGFLEATRIIDSH